MRCSCIALAILVSSAAAASAQGFQVVDPDGKAAMVRAEVVVTRLMSFDRDRDGVITAAELSERMQGLMARGDRSGDGALDAFEIRSMVSSTQPTVNALSSLSGGYGFGDSALSSRTHIDNSIDDLRLARQTTQEAKRIAWAFVDEFEGVALANLRASVAPVLTKEQLAGLDANVARHKGRLWVEGETRPSMTVVALASVMSFTSQTTPEQRQLLSAVAEKVRAEQQLDDARRSALVSRLSGLLTDEESDNLRAALARRPLVKRQGFISAR